MAQWTFVDPNTLLPGDPWTSAKAQAAFENLEAVAEGAPGAPRVLPEALNFRVAEVDPAGMASVVFTDLEPADWALEFYTIQPDSTSNMRLLLERSYDNGVSFEPTLTILSESANFRSTASDRLGGLSGFAKASSNVFSDTITGSPTVSRILQDSFVLTPPNISIQITKPFQPMNAIRIRWNAGSFGADDNQRIVLYQGGRRPFGGKP